MLRQAHQPTTIKQINIKQLNTNNFLGFVPKPFHFISRKILDSNSIFTSFLFNMINPPAELPIGLV